MRVLTRSPEVGETLTYINKDERTQLRVRVVAVSQYSHIARVETLAPILKLDGTGLVLNAYPEMLYE